MVLGRTFQEELKQKKISAEEAAKLVKSGDWLEYSHFVMVPKALDTALARRKDEIRNVVVRGVCMQATPQVALVEPKFEHFIYCSGFYSSYERKIGDRCQSFVTNYSRNPLDFRRGNATPLRLAFIVTTPMDKHGYFNFGTSCSHTQAVCDIADIVVVETNSTAPVCLGGEQNGLPITKVDYVVEGDNEPIPEFPQDIPATDVEKKIAELIVSQIEDRSCIQLGIGGLANYIGKVLAQSDLKDLGMHSEMMCDAFIDLYESGKLTGKYKTFGKYKMTYTFAMGSRRLYDFLHYNQECAAFPVDITNDPRRIGLNDKVVSINNALMVDLYAQVASEMVDFRHISGPGGQLDFVLGAYYSEGGKSFLCLPSTRVLENGRQISRIVPFIPQGMTITDSRTVVDYVVTEYGLAHMAGKTNWQRAENLIQIAHPDFRDELIQAAQKQGIWTKTNKI
jgi:acyl-CoA hydrolase